MPEPPAGPRRHTGHCPGQRFMVAVLRLHCFKELQPCAARRLGVGLKSDDAGRTAMAVLRGGRMIQAATLPSLNEKSHYISSLGKWLLAPHGLALVRKRVEPSLMTGG